MISGFEKIVEERIRRAMEEGAFEGLAGAGEPLRLEEEASVPEELRLAYRILKNADCLPPEIELRREIEKTEELLAAMPDTEAKYRALKKLNLLVLKVNSLRRTPIALELPQRYLERVVGRIEKKRKPR